MFKTIGIIGGMGPAATADLLNKITEVTDVKCDQDHVHVVIDSNINIPDRTAAILEGGADPLPEMAASAKLLEKAGADMIIIACNTAHYFVPELAKKTSLPIISMPDETARVLKEKGISKAAILATDGTVRSGIYQKALDTIGIEAINPDKQQQKIMMSLIYDYIKKGITDADCLPAKEVRAVVENLKQCGAEALILACTELPIAFEVLGLNDKNIIDPTRVLATAAVRAAGAPLRKNAL